MVQVLSVQGGVCAAYPEPGAVHLLDLPEAMKPNFISEEQFAAMVKRKDVDPIEQVRKVAQPQPYRSKWEAAYASKLELEKHAGLIKAWWYEPFSLWLPGKVRYKPDFLIQYPDGLEQRLEVIEVKGWSKNRRDGMTRLKIAAAIFPCFTWRLVYRTKGGGWDGEYL